MSTLAFAGWSRPENHGKERGVFFGNEVPILRVLQVYVEYLSTERNRVFDDTENYTDEQAGARIAELIEIERGLESLTEQFVDYPRALRGDGIAIDEQVAHYLKSLAEDEPNPTN